MHITARVKVKPGRMLIKGKRQSGRKVRTVTRNRLKCCPGHLYFDFSHAHIDPGRECRKLSTMTNKSRHTLLSTLLIALLLSACVPDGRLLRGGESIQNLERETANLADVSADTLELVELAGKEHVLVVFDIDNTLLAMEQDLGSDQWYEWQKALASEDQCNPQNVGNRFAVQGALYFASAMRPTQEDGAEQVRTIQQRGVAVISLSSRGPDYQLQTFRELRRNHFSFSYSAIGPQGGYIEPFIPVENGRLSLYEDGVFLTAGQHKGQMLQALLIKTGTRMPAVIVMADDKQQNLDAVKETFAALNVPVHAWRYSAEDDNVGAFNPGQADSQWKSIEAPLRQIQQVLGPDNYDLTEAVLPPECDQSLPSPPVAGD